MKLYSALLATCFFLSALAQTTRQPWDARVSLGITTYPYMQKGGHLLDFDVFLNTTESTVYSASLFHQLGNRKIKVGLSFAHVKISRYNPGSISFSGFEPPYEEESYSVTSLMPSISYSYLITRRSQLYSEGSLGIAVTKTQNDIKQSTHYSVDPAFQCTFLGYRFGGRAGIFVEAGYGYKGLLQSGVSLTF